MPPLHPELIAYLLGVTGSLAVELAQLLKSYEQRGRLPARYARWGFWLTRVLFAAVAGVLAWTAFTPAQHNFFYFALGAGAQAVIAQLREPVGDPADGKK